jgi:TRAP-type C4-dicarboxylate transport system substrate-binding protein
LSAADKAALKRVLVETADWVTEQIVESEEELADWFRKQGVTVNKVNRAPFIKAVAPELTKGGLPFDKKTYQRMQKIADAK